MHLLNILIAIKKYNKEINKAIKKYNPVWKKKTMQCEIKLII